MNKEVQHIIKNAPGVMSILGPDDNPEALRESEVRRMLGKIDQVKEEGETIGMNFIVGENVVISEGPFTSFNATIEEVNEDKKKLRVAIKIFGRRTPVDIDFSQVVKQ